MAYVAHRFERMCGGVTSLFHYDEAVTLATIKASGYFNPAVNQIKKNDIIALVGSDGASWAIVTSATGALPVTVVTPA